MASRLNKAMRGEKEEESKEEKRELRRERASRERSQEDQEREREQKSCMTKNSELDRNKGVEGREAYRGHLSRVE